MAEMAANWSSRFLNYIFVEDTSMKQPPDTHSYMRNGYPPFNPEPNPSQPDFGADIRLPRSRRQKLFIIAAFLLTGIVALSIPFFALQQYIKPNLLASAHANPTSVATNGKTTIPSPTATPEPLGTTILPPAGKILTGVSIADSSNALATYEKDAGKNTSIILSYQAWGDASNDFPADWTSTVRKQGAIPMITWEPWKTVAYPQGNDEPTYSLKNISDGKFDAYITQWAQEAKAWRDPFFLRFAPEMNGNWTPWSEGVNGNEAGDFVKAWQHVHDIFTANGVTNATWVWCPNIENTNESAPLSEFYPGNAYVDWTAMDGFNWGTTSQYNTWLTFSQVFGSTYDDIQAITTKPMIISEISTVEEGGDKAAWITDAYSVELPTHFPNVRGIVWFNQITQEDWRIESSLAAQAAFAQAIKASNYASNTFGDYMGGAGA
jgi:beta-mannanase